jgi:tRNA-2-methylthio-N6-dimethylallyladenosine synthase
MAVIEKKMLDEALQGSSFNPFKIDANIYEKHFYIESYGCAMNFNDTEVIASILYQSGYGATKNMEDADLILVNTCSIREKAEQTVRNRLMHFKGLKRRRKGMLVGVLGCMAERLKGQLLEEEKLVDIVIGPDAYRTLPQLIEEAQGGQRSMNVLLSREETYADISPVRLDSNGVSAFVSIMRGCNNMCSFCVVPFTRGRERSRAAKSILQECKDLVDNGYKEITLLGQNVDSYLFIEDDGNTTTFAQLLEAVALLSENLRVRFSTSHPKDITDDVLYTIKKYDNICNYIHLPLQAGSTRVLQQMNRTYTKEWYKAKVDRIYEIIPNCAISTDIIVGFPSETEQELDETVELVAYSRFEYSFTYVYSERGGTLAARRYPDDIPHETKIARLEKVIAMQRKISTEIYQEHVGRTHKILVEGPSKKNEEDYNGRTDCNKMVVFKKGNAQKGDYLNVLITSATSGTLMGQIIE